MAADDGPSAPGKTLTDYNNIYSTRNNLIMAHGNYKLENEPLFWSDVTFALWTGIISRTGGDARNIQYIGRAWVCNAFTASIIYTALAKMQVKRIANVRPNDESFFAMLGTPNGAGGVYLLMQHKQVLGFKTFSQVVIGLDFDGPDSSPWLVFKAVYMPSPRLLNTGGGGGVCNSSHISGNAGLTRLES